MATRNLQQAQPITANDAQQPPAHPFITEEMKGERWKAQEALWAAQRVLAKMHTPFRIAAMARALARQEAFVDPDEAAEMLAQALQYEQSQLTGRRRRMP